MAISVLLLGSRSFIGKSLLEYWEQAAGGALGVTGISSAQLDLTDRDAVDDFFSKNSYDYVILSAVAISNVEASLAMFFNVVRNSKSYGLLINLGSGAEYDPARYIPTMPEDYAKGAFPDSGYPLIKAVQGKFIEQDEDFRGVNLRIFGIYGRYEDSSRRYITSNIVSALATGKITCRQDMLFDYVHVDVLAAFLMNVMSHRKRFSYKTYNFCSSNPVSLVDLGEVIKARIKGAEFEVLNSGCGGEYSGDCSRLEAEFGSLVHPSFESSISELVDIFKDIQES
tara:strand:- start:1358 stop:2206 length:849 start_codon:yes stop_codon:yes gene_type:complete